MFSNPLNRKATYWAGALILLAVFVTFFHNSIPDVVLAEDEADYVYAANKGFFGNYLDRKTLPFTTFLKMGLSRGTQKDSKTDLSKFIRSSDDISVYRHWHGPLYFYYLSLGRWIFGDSDFRVRMYSLLFQFFCALAVFSGCMLLLRRTCSFSVSLLTALCLLGSVSLYVSTMILSTHGALTFTCILCLFFLIKAVQTGAEGYFFLSAAFLALTFLSNEYAAAMMVTWVICALFVKYRLGKNNFKLLRVIRTSFLIWIGVIFVMWPASIIKLSLLKSYITQAYFMIYRGSAFSPMPIWKYWMTRFEHLPVDMSIAFSGLLLGSFLLVRKRKYMLFPIITYMVLILATTLRNQCLNPTYTVTFIAAGTIALGISVSFLLEKKRFLQILTLATLCVIQFSFLKLTFLPEFINAPSPKTQMVRYIEKEKPQRILAVRFSMPIIRHYYPSVTVDTFTPEIYGSKESLADISNALSEGKSYNGLIFHGKNLEPVIELVSNRYDYDSVQFESWKEEEKWVYFRLKPKDI
ncbi:MAG: ArnT family glycosyltransferase [Fibrobacterota bacterium]